MPQCYSNGSIPARCTFVINKVSLKFQEENSVVAEASQSIKTTIAQLNAMRSKDGPFLQKIKEFKITDLPFKGLTPRSLDQLKRGHYDLSIQRQNLLDNITEALCVQFEDASDGVLKAISIANFREWTLEERELQGLDHHSSSSSSQILYFCPLCLLFIMLLRVEQFWCLFTAACCMKLLHDVFLCVSFKFWNLKIEVMK